MTEAFSIRAWRRRPKIDRIVAKQRPKGWAIESGTGEPIVAAQAAMLGVHWAMTAPLPVSRTMRFHSW